MVTIVDDAWEEAMQIALHAPLREELQYDVQHALRMMKDSESEFRPRA